MCDLDALGEHESSVRPVWNCSRESERFLGDQESERLQRDVWNGLGERSLVVRHGEDQLQTGEWSEWHRWMPCLSGMKVASKHHRTVVDAIPLGSLTPGAKEKRRVAHSAFCPVLWMTYVLEGRVCAVGQRQQVEWNCATEYPEVGKRWISQTKLGKP